MKLATVLAAALFCISSVSYAKGGWNKMDGIYAVFNTSKGKIVCRLFSKETPMTVDNFVGLAEGTREWLDPKTGKPSKNKFYDGLIFHRVIPNFMIQGGCPLGMGYGGPGYTFKDEFVQSLVFDKPGLLAMANSGPATNGSQFFITQVPTPWLSGKHTIFGEVVEGMDVVNTIAAVQRGPNDKPVEPVIIKNLEIKRIGDAYQIKKDTAIAAPVKKVLFVVAPKDFRDEEYFETKNIVEKAGYKTVTAGLAKGELLGMLGGKAVSDISLAEVNLDDYAAVIFVGGSGSMVFWSDPYALQLARETAAKDKVLGAICFAPGTLARAGVLQGKNVTAFSSIANDITASKAVFTGKPVEVDGKLITGSGPEASIEFGNAVVNLLNK